MSLKVAASLLLVLCCLHGATATLGVDLSSAANTFSCMKSNGMSFAITRGYCSYGGVDKNAAQNLKNAKAAGLITDAYHFPCVSKSATTQANELIDALKGSDGKSLFGTVWVDVESNPSSGCGWTSNINTNCDFLKNLVAAYKAKGKLVGIYASRYQWQSIFGASGNCAAFTSLPVWYAHYDGVASFSDWSSVSFGGWSKPSIKQYKGDVTLCGTGVDMNYY